METDFLQLGKSILTQQPFSVFLGTQVTVFKTGLVELVTPIRPEFKQQHGFVHGGVISYAADNAFTFAGGSALGTEVVTSEYKINYLRPARGESLIARAQVIYAGKSQAVCRCDIFSVIADEEVLCATTQGTIARLGTPG